MCPPNLLPRELGQLASVYASRTSKLGPFAQPRIGISPIIMRSLGCACSNKVSGSNWPTGGIVATYRTTRPLLVEATRCTTPRTIVTDLGERVVRAGDWIISGEDNERYIVDDAFFQRTFKPLEWMRSAEGKEYGC